MAASKFPHASPTPVAIEWTLPADLLLEIVARSDTRTLVRGAATCKLLRRDILSISYINCVTQQGGIVSPWILACLNRNGDEIDRPPSLSLIYPSTPAAVSFSDHHMSAYMSRFTDDLLREHHPVISRGGLVLLCQNGAKNYLSNLCVYDLNTGHRTFLSDPLVIDHNHIIRSYNCVLLNASDGIKCAFLLLVAILESLPGSNTCNIQVRTITSTSGTWAPPATIHDTTGFSFHRWFPRDAIVLHGGIIHWLVRHRAGIFTYNVCTMEQGMIKLPTRITKFKGKLHLGSYYSHDGQKLLRLFGIDGFRISVWHQAAGGDWVPEDATIDTEQKLRSIEPNIIITGRPVFTQFKCSGEGSRAVLLRVYRPSSENCRHFVLTILDVETKEMRVQDCSTSPFVLLEVDLPSRLRSLKIIP